MSRLVPPTPSLGEGFSQRAYEQASQGLSDAFLVELRLATDSFRVEQQKHLERFHAQIEWLLLRQQGAVEDHVKSRDDLLGRTQTMYTFDHSDTSCTIPMLEDYDDPDSDSDPPANTSGAQFGAKGLAKAASRDVVPQEDDTPAPAGADQWNEFKQVMRRRRLKWDRLQYVVRHRYFVMLGSLAIITNVVYIGVVINNNIVSTIKQYKMHDGKASEVGRPSWEVNLDFCYAVLFTVEIVMRMLGEEFEFFLGPEWNWNCMDLLLVVTSVAEIIISIQKSTVNLAFVRLLRLLRVVRTLRSVRILRVLRLFSKFRMLLGAIQNCLSPLTWACVLLFWMLYMASLVFLNGVAEYFVSGEIEVDVVEILQNYFGSLDGCLLTLFMCISGGLNWEVAAFALLKVHVAYGLLFVLFIASMMLAALNIFAGIFVNDAIELCQQDRDHVIQAQNKKSQAMQKELKELFLESDTDDSGTLTRKEFMLAFENPEVKARFTNLGVELDDKQSLSSLFDMLDLSEDDELGIDEFASVCLRAKTLTRPVDLQSFIQQNRRTTDQVRRGLTDLEHQVNKVVRKIDKVFPKSLPLHARPQQKRVTSVPELSPTTSQRDKTGSPNMVLALRCPPSTRPWLDR